MDIKAKPDAVNSKSKEVLNNLFSHHTPDVYVGALEPNPPPPHLLLSNDAYKTKHTFDGFNSKIITILLYYKTYFLET